MPITRTRKRQSRLDFTPLPVSSPAKSAQPLATRSRAAAVSIKDSSRPPKRAKITDGFLPTPERSSQPQPVAQSAAANSSTPPASSNPRPFMRPSKAKRQSSQRLAETPSRYDELVQTFDDSESESISQTRSPLRNYQSESDDVRTPSRPLTRRMNAVNVENRSDADTEIAAHTPRMRRQPSPVVLDDSGSDNDSSSKASSAVTPQVTPRKLSKQVQQDLHDDLEDLRSSSPPAAIKPSQASARNAALAAYKKNRASQQRNGTPKAGKAKRQRVILDDDDNDDGDEVESGDDAIYPDAEQQEDYYYDENDNNDFIIEDEGDPGAESALPLEWKLQSAKPSQLFEFVVEWMVQKRLNPAFRSEDAVYDIAFRKVDDLARYMGGSKFQSSAWTSEFSRALKARPELDETRFVNAGLHDRCDACNRSGHPATFECQFKGSTYNRKTLEDVSDDEEDVTRDADLAPEDRVFYIGKFCMRNTRAAHALAHWRYHLNEWVVDWLEAEHYLDGKAIVKRDRWTTEKRRKFANEVVDHMKEIGEVKQLYRSFKAEIETAQNQDQLTRYSSP